MNLLSLHRNSNIGLLSWQTSFESLSTEGWNVVCTMNEVSAIKSIVYRKFDLTLEQVSKVYAKLGTIASCPYKAS